MKVGFLLSSFLPYRIGGTEVYVYRLIRLLQQANLTCFVLTSSNAAAESEYAYQGIRVINIPAAEGIRTERHDFLKRVIATEQPYLFHVHELISPDGFTISDLEFIRRSHVPIVTTLHVLRYSCFLQDLKYKGKSDCNGIPERMKCTTCFLSRKNVGILSRPIASFSKYLFDKNYIIHSGSGKLNTLCNIYSILSKHIDTLDQIFEYSSAVVAVSKWYHNMLAEINSSPKLQLIQTGMFAAIQDSRKQPDDAIVFAYCGRLTPDKGIDILIDAFVSLANSHQVLKIYSDTESEKNGFVECCIDKTSSFANIHWCKPFPPEDSKKVLDAADVLVVPTRITEMSPLVIHEAKSSGIFIIASSNMGNDEALRNYTKCILYQESKVESLARTIGQITTEMLAIDTDLNNDKTFYFDNTASQYMDLYEGLLLQSSMANHSRKSLSV
jgi:glycosyltransferase involved in cell wall biosynthesis